MTREKELRPDDLEPPWTVKKLLRWTSGYFEDQDVTETPRLDADLLLGKVLELDRVQLYARSDQPVSEEERTEFRQLVKRRVAGEPVAYLVGHREFWGLEFSTDDRALIPRPETERLVEAALDRLPEDESIRVADVGTGTGAVAVALADERPAWEMLATDVSSEALELAAQNVEHHGFGDRIELLEGDLLDAVPEDWRPVDAVVANLPYVPAGDRGDVMIDVRDHEPDQALFAGDGGVETIGRLIDQADEALAGDGWLMLEIAHDQGEHVRSMLEGWEGVDVVEDYGGHDRVVVAEHAA